MLCAVILINRLPGVLTPSEGCDVPSFDRAAVQLFHVPTKGNVNLTSVSRGFCMLWKWEPQQGPVVEASRRAAGLEAPPQSTKVGLAGSQAPQPDEQLSLWRPSKTTSLLYYALDRTAFNCEETAKATIFTDLSVVHAVRSVLQGADMLVYWTARTLLPLLLIIIVVVVVAATCWCGGATAAGGEAPCTAHQLTGRILDADDATSLLQ